MLLWGSHFYSAFPTEAACSKGDSEKGMVSTEHWAAGNHVFTSLWLSMPAAGPGAGTSDYQDSLCLCCTCPACRAVPQLPLICLSTVALVVINARRPAALKVIAEVPSNPCPSMIFCSRLELGLKCGFEVERCSCMGSSSVPHRVSSQFSPVFS